MNIVSAWVGGRTRAERGGQARNRGAMAKYPTETRVVLADGQIMNVRNASLAAAKDLLAAQRAVERRMQAGVR